MKHMWSEEEIQTLIEGQGGSDEIILENIVDSMGRQRFICGIGEAFNVPGITGTTCKWTLNGTNLIFEILGSFSQSVEANTWLFSFEIPEWIYNKIALATGQIIDSIEYSYASLETGLNKSSLFLYKTNNNIIFVQAMSVSITNPVFFRIKWNTIINTE